MKFDELNSQTYKSLSQCAKIEVKKIFLDSINVKIDAKKIQRWFNEPDKAPEEYVEKMIKAIYQVVEKEVKINNADIAKYRLFLNRSLIKHQTFQQFLTKYITFKI